MRRHEMMLGVAGYALYAGGNAGGEDRVAHRESFTQITLITIESQFRRT